MIWNTDERHPLPLTLYKCVATGENRGMIEVVLDAKTTAQIQKAEGGITGVFKVFSKKNFLKKNYPKKTPLSNYLTQHNSLPDDYLRAVKNFSQSCAAYSVAAYILGLGDR